MRRPLSLARGQPVGPRVDRLQELGAARADQVAKLPQRIGRQALHSDASVEERLAAAQVVDARGEVVVQDSGGHARLVGQRVVRHEDRLLEPQQAVVGLRDDPEAQPLVEHGARADVLGHALHQPLERWLAQRGRPVQRSRPARLVDERGMVRPGRQQARGAHRRGALLADGRVRVIADHGPDPVDFLPVDARQERQSARGLLAVGQCEFPFCHLHESALHQLREHRVGDAEVQQESHERDQHAPDPVEQEPRSLGRRGVVHGGTIADQA